MPQETPTPATQVNTRLPLPLAQQLWGAAKKREWSPSQYVRWAICAALEREAKADAKKAVGK